MANLADWVYSSGDYKLAFCVPNSNWDIYINSDNKALSIAKTNGAYSSFFGDVGYICRLMCSGYFDNEIKGITEHGREIFSGYYTKLITGSNGKQFGILRKK